MSAAQIWDIIQWLLLPALGGCFGLFWRAITRADAAMAETIKVREESIRSVADAKADVVKELSQFKLEVARTYASIEYLKDVEKRITDHLVRIENKLDVRVGSSGVSD